MKFATFGGGCFWCIEAVIQRLDGVESVVSGYSGGNVPGVPTYREVCSGLTGHAEVIQVGFNEDVISYEDLIGIFMSSHDPTTSNRQGADRGTQYRSVIYYHDNQQKEIAEKVMKNVSVFFDDTIVTELSALEIFHPAEKDHQDYYNANKEKGYCSVVIGPKIAKLKQAYGQRLKEEYR